MADHITLVDRGRGLQLSTSRITVLDLVPYFRRGSPYEEIMRWLPTLTVDEISVVKQYYEQHKDELDQKEQQIREYREEQSTLQQCRFPELEGTTEERLADLRQRLHRAMEAKNGERHPA